LALIGGTCAVWVRAGEAGGIARLTARHPRLGERSVNFTLSVAPEESV
jgi:beta-galactosidase